MTPEPQPNNNERLEKIFRIVRESALIQATQQCRENYFQSCTNHEGDIANVTNDVRKDLSHCSFEGN